MAETDKPKVNSEVEKLRILKAFWLSVIGLSLAALLVVILLVYGFNKASEITSVVGLFTSVLGTLVGAFFGLQIGTAGKEKAEQRADEAQKRANALQGAATPEVLERARDIYPRIFE